MKKSEYFCDRCGGKVNEDDLNYCMDYNFELCDDCYKKYNEILERFDKRIIEKFTVARRNENDDN